MKNILPHVTIMGFNEDKWFGSVNIILFLTEEILLRIRNMRTEIAVKILLSDSTHPFADNT